MAKQVKLDTKMLDKIIKVIGAEEVPSYVVADGVEYGIYVEFGTTRQRAKPALIPAFEKHTKVLPAILGDAIEKAVPLSKVLRVTAFNIQADWQIAVPVDTGALKNSIKTRAE